jgi:hypothetical protein
LVIEKKHKGLADREDGDIGGEDLRREDGVEDGEE